ncbi:MAG: recombination regulator RecX [Gammaproteobacteria bacterium]|nr:recombination regulator RecX [Gammaproteobacteria bacterium]
MSKEVRLAAMNLLARREHSQQELHRKLINKGFEADEVRADLAILVEEGLQSDERFTEAFINSRLQRGSGPVKIALELQQRGVAESTVKEYLDERDPQWTQCAIEVRNKKYGEAAPDDFKERSRQMRFLQYRGFTMQQIQQAVGEEID